MLRLSEGRGKTVTELVESLCEQSAESSLLELSRGEAKDIKVPALIMLSACTSIRWLSLSKPPRDYNSKKTFLHASL